MPTQSLPAGPRGIVLGSAVLLTVVALGLAACSGRSHRSATGPTAALTTSTGPPSFSSGDVPTTDPTTDASTPPRTTARTTAAAVAQSTTAPPPTQRPVTRRPSSPQPSQRPATYQPRCATSALAFGAQRGSGAMQQQYATISVANHGRSACWLVGYPGVVLVSGGAPLGRPAAPAGVATTAVHLIAAGTATASLHGPSTCNAGVSDHVRVSAPASTSHTDVALPMRACPLTIGAFRTT